MALSSILARTMPRTGARLAEDTTVLFLSVMPRIANDTLSISFSIISEADKAVREDASGGFNACGDTDIGWFEGIIGSTVFSPILDNN
ncbi:hypothetical protein [Endozoicomonas sp. YOMI1]|uniref:hypothetical protein n=1 Tax=Endozoicomonas sp. YOMI1 TaxID=2828739 RepID=UPI002148999F|nr:hypothetical protein [Endozoicomonas sp. YOMI1]